MTTSAGISRPTDVTAFVDRMVRPLAGILNPLVLRVAGGRWFPMFSLLHHRGHRSGRMYATPVTAMPRGDSFWLGLTFGEGSGWARNVIAAGECDLRYRGTDYHLVRPEVVEAAEVRSELPPVMRVAMSLVRVHKVLRMRPALKAT